MNTNNNTVIRRRRGLAVGLVAGIIMGGTVVPSWAASPSVSPWEKIHSENTDAGAPDDRSPEIVASGRTLHTVWMSNVGYSPCYLSYRRSTDGGRTWQNRVILQTYDDQSFNSVVAGDSTRLTVDGDDVHIVQRRSIPGSDGHYELDYFRSTNGGVSFEPARVILRGRTGWNVVASRISATGGKVAIAFGYNANWNPDPSGHVLVSLDRGESFVAVPAVADAYDTYDYNWGVIACMDLKWLNGRIVSVWKTNGTVPFVSAVSNLEATSFTTVSLLAARTEAWTPPGDTMLPQWCAGTADTLHLIWNQRNPSGRSALYYARSLDGGVTYEAGRDLSEGTIGTEEVRGGRVAMVAKGNHVYVCYVANSSGGLFLRTSKDGGATFGAAVPLHLPGTMWYGNAECPSMALDPQDADGSTVWFAFAIPSASGSSAVRHTDDGGTTISPLLMPASPYDWGNWYPHSFRLCPVGGSEKTAWVMLYGGTRPGYDADVYFRPLAPEPAPAPGGNQALHFAGLGSTSRSDLVQVPSAPALQFTNSLTAEVWVRATPTTNIDHSGMEILQWGDFSRSLSLRCFNSGLTVNATFKTTAATYTLGNGFPLGDRAWHHLAVSYDATAGPMNLRFYIDGHLNHAVTATGQFAQAPQPLMIGGPSLGQSSTQPFSGDADNLRLWNRALSESEIRESARKTTLTGGETGLAAAYSFDASVKDLSGNGADGMLLYGADYYSDATVPAQLMTEWADDFSSNSVRGAYWQTNTSAASFTADTTHGDVRVSKPLGPVGSDEYIQESVWRASGDFDVSVDFRDAQLTRSMAWGNHLALVCKIGATGYYLIRSDENGIGHNLSLSAVPGAGRIYMRNISPTAGNLRLIRRGTRLSTFMDGEPFYEVTCTTDPMDCRLQLYNNTTPDAISATFDNFQIAATTLERRWNTFAVPAAPSADDLWNHTLGTVIDGSSPTYAAVDMPPILSFGANNGNVNEPEHTVFGDGLSADYEHWMEWHMPAGQTVRSIALWTVYGTPDRSRGIRHFMLQGKLAQEDPWTTLLDTDLPRTYSAAAPALAMNLHHPMNARYYRAVFLRVTSEPIHGDSGPRVMELDGFETPFANPPTDNLPGYLHAQGLDGAASAPLADADGDGVPNLLEYAAGTDAGLASSAPPPLVTGAEGTAESGRFLTVTMRLAKPVPEDLEISGEFTMDPGMSPWMFTGITGTDADQGDHIDRTFKAPLMIGFPPTGFMRVRVGTR